MQPASKTVVAYWDFYDSDSGRLLEKDRKINQSAMPSQGALITNIPGKPNAVVRLFKFRGAKDGLPCYDVYV
ncbi:MAG: hypothetical protein PHO26_02585 [Dehalococcoidia bacterium]|nr:hypothetical protein [Dehalococcoidia bacterium]MDD5493793.1 hypothetical protein [Dehalococcoidia bacterium]